MTEIHVHECNKNLISFIINDALVLRFLSYIISGCDFLPFLIWFWNCIINGWPSNSLIKKTSLIATILSTNGHVQLEVTKKHLVLEMWNNGNFIYMILSEGLPRACFVCDEQCNTQTRTKYGSKGSNVKHPLKSSCDVTDHSCKWWKKKHSLQKIFSNSSYSKFTIGSFFNNPLIYFCCSFMIILKMLTADKAPQNCR